MASGSFPPFLSVPIFLKSYLMVDQRRPSFAPVHMTKLKLPAKPTSEVAAAAAPGPGGLHFVVANLDAGILLFRL